MNGDIDRDILKNSFEDIRFSKKQQWHVIYLVLLAIGAIIALVLSLTDKELLDAYYKISFRTLLKIGIGLLTVGGIGFTWNYVCDIRKYRKAKDDLLQKLGRQEPKKARLDVYFVTVFFSFVIIFAAIIATCVIAYAAATPVGAEETEKYCEREFGGKEMYETCLEQERAARARMVGREVDLDTWAFCASTFPDSYAMQAGCMDIREDVPAMKAGERI